MALQRLYTVAQVAESLQVHRESVRRLVRQGRLGAVRLGALHSELRIPAAAVEAYYRDQWLGPRRLAKAVRPRRR